MTRVRDARTALADARARRSAAEGVVEQTWQDAARRAFQARILQRLERETGQVDAAMRELDQELVRALAVLSERGS